MISKYTEKYGTTVLASDPAAEHPLYLYWPKDKSTLLYSQSITELLDDPRVPKPLTISNEGVSFLLQSGVVPPPKTAYEDIYILGIGDQARVSAQNGKVEVEFTHEFPFLNGNRLPPDEMEPDEDKILEMLAEATISRIDPSRPSFLFHSAGKDSNSIALALAEAGWQDKVTLISHKSKGKADESEISAKIANQLGFRHQVLHEVDTLGPAHKQAIQDYFVSAPFPCTDNVTLAYPLYACQVPDLKGANIIDGMGNDVYIGHIPSAREFRNQKLSRVLNKGRFLSKYARSESGFNRAGRSRAECTDMFGFSLADARLIFKGAYDVSYFWKEKDSDDDYLDFRASIRGTIIDQEIFTRKVRNFSSASDSRLILPFANLSIAKYFSQLPEKHLFDRTTLKNKLILRKILKDRLGLDSDELGKFGFSYDSRSVVLQNWEDITAEISMCFLWDQEQTKKIVSRLKLSMLGKRKYSDLSGRLIYRLYLISSWVNNCKYI